jgi:hypothetical protein
VLKQVLLPILLYCVFIFPTRFFHPHNYRLDSELLKVVYQAGNGE